jgi:hypothetical protein
MDTGISLCGVNYFFRGASQLPGVLGKAMKYTCSVQKHGETLMYEQVRAIKFPSTSPVSSTIIPGTHVNYMKRRGILATNMPLLLLLYRVNGPAR